MPLPIQPPTQPAQAVAVRIGEFTIQASEGWYRASLIHLDADGNEVVSPYYLRVNAPTLHTIRDLSTVSAVGGYIRSNEVGARIRLRKMRSGEIFVLEKYGTWTIDS